MVLFIEVDLFSGREVVKKVGDIGDVVVMGFGDSEAWMSIFVRIVSELVVWF